MQLRIIYTHLFDEHGEHVAIGGIQTYLRELGECAARIGIQPVVYQCGSHRFVKDLGALTVYGIPAPRSGRKSTLRILYRGATADIASTGDILLFGSNTLSVPTEYPRAILIQHGIFWDKPDSNEGRFAVVDRFPGARMLRVARRHSRYIKQFDNCRYRVCVDYNFQNWYRTYCARKEGYTTWVVPNYAPVTRECDIRTKLNESRDYVRILYARRFETYRGTRIFAEALASILPRFGNVVVTFAGDGPDSEWLKATFEKDSRVGFRKVPWEDRMQLSFEHDIAVVPSLGSEGTSLSLAEAMASGCAVIASDVGGMTNMILSGFNGILVPPESRCFAGALARLIQDSALRRELALNGYQVAARVFSKERWEASWCHVLQCIRDLSTSGRENPVVEF